MVHGVLGALGNSDCGMKAITTKVIVEGVAGGFTGLLVCPFVVALRFTAKISEVSVEMAQISFGVVKSQFCPLRYVVPNVLFI